MPAGGEGNGGVGRVGGEYKSCPSIDSSIGHEGKYVGVESKYIGVESMTVV